MSGLSGRTTAQKHNGSLPSQISELKKARTLVTPKFNHLVDPLIVRGQKLHEQLRRVLTLRSTKTTIEHVRVCVRHSHVMKDTQTAPSSNVYTTSLIASLCKTKRFSDTRVRCVRTTKISTLPQTQPKGVEASVCVHLMSINIYIYICIYLWTHRHGYEKPTRLAGAPVRSSILKSCVPSKSTSAPLSCLERVGSAGDSTST